MSQSQNPGESDSETDSDTPGFHIQVPNLEIPHLNLRLPESEISDSDITLSPEKIETQAPEELERENMLYGELQQWHLKQFVCVYYYPVPEGLSGQQVVDSLQRQIELLGAVKTGNFYVDCETYQSNIQQPGTAPRLLHVLHNSEQPASCYSVLDTGTILKADVLFEVLVAKLVQVKVGKDALYQQRKGFKMESKGQRYELGDFVIKLGSVSQASNFKGILVEVEYCPCSIPSECWNLMRELMQSFLGNHAETQPIIIKNKMDSFYSPEDTIGQYLEHFSNFRKSQTMNQPIR